MCPLYARSNNVKANLWWEIYHIKLSAPPPWSSWPKLLLNTLLCAAGRTRSSTAASWVLINLTQHRLQQSSSQNPTGNTLLLTKRKTKNGIMGLCRHFQQTQMIRFISENILLILEGINEINTSRNGLYINSNKEKKDNKKGRMGKNDGGMNEKEEGFRDGQIKGEHDYVDRKKQRKETNQIESFIWMDSADSRDWIDSAGWLFYDVHVLFALTGFSHVSERDLNTGVNTTPLTPHRFCVYRSVILVYLYFTWELFKLDNHLLGYTPLKNSKSDLESCQFITSTTFSFYTV